MVKKVIKPELIYALITGGSFVIMTTDTEDIREFLSKSLNPERYGLLSYKNGAKTFEYPAEHPDITPFMPKKRATVKPIYRNIIKVLVDHKLTRSERGAKQAISRGRVFVNDVLVESADFNVDYSKSNAVRIGQPSGAGGSGRDASLPGNFVIVGKDAPEKSKKKARKNDRQRK